MASHIRRPRVASLYVFAPALCAVLAVACAAGPSASHAPTPHAPSTAGAPATPVARDADAAPQGALASYQRARAALNRAVDAVGGVGALAAIQATGFRFTGSSAARGQSSRPGAAYATAPVSGRFVFAPGKRRILSEFRTEFSGGIKATTTVAIDGDRGFHHRHETGTWTALTAFDLGLARGGAASNPEKLLPHALLWTALSNPASLRWGGRSQWRARDVDRLSFAATDGRAVTLVCDAATHRVVAVETVTAVPGVGDTTNEIAFTDYRAVGGVQVPHAIEFLSGGEQTMRWALSEVRIDPAIEDAWFEPPADAQVSPYKMSSFKPEKLGDGVYAVRLWSGNGSSYNAMFVEFADHVVVVETPLVDALSRAMMQIVASVAPDKPIRYVIPTHYHSDHIGGVGAYVRAGVTAVTTPGNRAHVEMLARIPNSLAPGALFARVNDPGGAEPGAIEVVEGGARTFRDQTQELRVYDVGPNPHVDEILVAYLPRHKVLFVSDLFGTSHGGGVGPASPALRAFGDKLRALGLDVETIVPGHGPIATKADLDRALAR